MIYYEDDFISNTNIVLSIIQNLFENVNLTLHPEGLNFLESDLTYNLLNIHDLDRMQLFIQAYFQMATSPLQKKIKLRGRPPGQNLKEDFTLEEMIVDYGVDFATSNYQFYLSKLKASERRYNPVTNEVDHYPAEKFFRQLSLFRYLYKYYFPLGLCPLSTDKLYQAFKLGLCPEHCRDHEGMAEAIMRTSDLYRLKLFQRDVLVEELRIPCINLDAAEEEREKVCKKYFEAHQEKERTEKAFSDASKAFEHRKTVGRDLLNAIANVYALGYRAVYDKMDLSVFIYEINSSHRSISPHDEATYYTVFPPAHFVYPDESNNFQALKEGYKTEDFFIIIGQILQNCYQQRAVIVSKFSGTFKHWKGKYEYDVMAQAVTDILNSPLGKYAMFIEEKFTHKFSWYTFRQLPPNFGSFDFDYSSYYRRAFETVARLEAAKFEAAEFKQQIFALDRRVSEILNGVEEKILATARTIHDAHSQYIHKKVLRRLSSSQERARAAKALRRSSSSETSGGIEGAPTGDDDVFGRRSSLKKRSSLFKANRALASQHRIVEEDKFQIVETLSGKEDNDFLDCLKLLIRHSGDYSELIAIRKALYRTYLAREVTLSIHVTWTGDKRRKCTEKWSHIERIIQILVLANMVARNVKLANMTRICDYYFFLIIDRHSAVIINENQKKVGGMAQRFFNHMRKKEYDQAMLELKSKWKNFVSLYNLPEMDDLEVLANDREIGREHFPSISEDIEEK